MNLEQYIELEFEDNGRGEKYDCWGLAIRILKDEFNYTLPDFSKEYSSSNDKFNIPLLVARERTNWNKKSTPEQGDVVLFNIGGYPLHVGIVVSKDTMIHISKGVNACLEKFTSKKWAKRIEGFYGYSKH